MRCASCGRDNPPGSSFCAFCGSPLRVASPEVREEAGWKGLPFYTRATIAGLVVFALIYTGLTVLAMVSGGSETIEDAVEGIVFYALFMIPTFVIVFLAWQRPGIWPLLAPIWAMLMLLIIAPLLPSALRTFNSFFDTGLLIPVIVSLLVASVTGFAGFLQRRRGAPRDASTTGERWVLRATAAMVVGLMAASGALHTTSLESVSSEEKAAAISVEMKNSAFKPDQLSVPAGKPAKLVIKNHDLTVHTFTIEELGIDVKVLPGSEELIELSSPPAGTYVYSCTFGIAFSFPFHKPEVESEPSIPSDSGTLVVSES